MSAGDSESLEAWLITKIERCVEAVVDHDAEALADMQTQSARDLYLWTRRYGRFGTVTLRRPPGAPQDWRIDALRREDDKWFVVIEMWTLEEGRSDLSLEVLFDETSTEILDLHVL